MVTTKGIVIREKSIGDNDKYLDILTEDLGVIEVRAKSSKKLTAKAFASCNIYTYSSFCLREYKGKYYIDSTTPINSFFGIATDIEKISLVVYFTDILKHTATDREESAKVLKIFLHALHYLEHEKLPTEQIKSVFEMLIMSAIGYEPNLGNCNTCDSQDTYFFSIEYACLYCKNCKPSNAMEISAPVVIALRYIITSELNRAFMFRLKDKKHLESLALLTQKYVFYHLDMSFRSLDYYYQIKSKG